MFVNLSNHPCYSFEEIDGCVVKVQKWEFPQYQAASVYGEVVDLTFPDIPPIWTTEEVEMLAVEYLIQLKEIKENATDDMFVVHLSGEIIFCFLLAQMLQNEGIVVVAATTIRIAEEKNGEKKSKFEFCQFRPYRIIKKK